MTCLLQMRGLGCRGAQGSGMLPELMLDLPPLHTLVIVKPYSWRGFVPSMQLQALQDVDLQVSHPPSSPHHPPTALPFLSPHE